MTSTATGTTPSCFPHPELTRITGAPTYLGLQQLKRELVANAISVHSIRGNGHLGHAVIILGNIEYNCIANPGGGNASNWVDFVHPGQNPVIPVIPAGATGPQIARIISAYDRSLNNFPTFTDTANTLKQQTLVAIDPAYICSDQ